VFSPAFVRMGTYRSKNNNFPSQSSSQKHFPSTSLSSNPNKKNSVLVKIPQKLHTLFNYFFFKVNHQKFAFQSQISISNFLHSNHKKFSFPITIFLIFTLIGFYCFPGFSFPIDFFWKLFNRSRFSVTLSSVKRSEKKSLFSARPSEQN
jgi:hypothetical protein